MPNILRLAAAVVAVLLFTDSSASARHHRQQYNYQQPQSVQPDYQRRHRRNYYQEHYYTNKHYAQVVGHPSGCPGRSFCGCGVSKMVFGRPVRELYLARNWYKFPRAHAAAGMVAVRRHHVMYIQSVDANGNATVYDPNSGGHQTRIHTRSLAGFTVVNPRTVLSMMPTSL